MARLLLDELWQYIGLKLPAADRIRFRAVCKTWMSLLPSRQPPWLLLAQSEDDDHNDNDEEEHPDPSLPDPPLPPPRCFAALGEQLPYQIHFPQIHRARCLGSTGNWLVTAHNDRSIRLLNPFSRRELRLPSQLDFEDGIDFHGNYDLGKIMLWKIILSSTPSHGLYQDCIAVAIHGGGKILAIARLGDAKWTTVRIENPPAPYTVNVEVADDVLMPLTVHIEIDDVVFYRGQLYGVTNRGELLVCDIGDDLRNSPKTTYISGSMEEFSVFRIKYLAEWMGELLMAVKCVGMIDDGLKYKTSRFEIYKFDFGEKKWNELKSLGEHSLFLGFSTSVSVCASDYFGVVKKNCVYFTDDFLFGYRDMGDVLDIEGGYDMGVFDLVDNSVRPHFSDVSMSRYSPPVWIVPN